MVGAQPTSVSPTLSASPLCTNNTLTLTGGVTGGTALTYLWTGPGGAAMTSTSTVNTQVPSLTTGNAGSYSLAVTGAGCTVVNGLTSSLVVNSLPTTFTATVSPNPVSACGSVLLTATATGAINATYAWTGPTTSDIVNPTSTTTASVTSAAAGDAGVYTLTASAPSCPNSTATTTALTVNGAPALTSLSTSVNLCYNGSIGQTANFTYGSAINGAINYTLNWSPSGPTGQPYRCNCTCGNCRGCIHRYTDSDEFGRMFEYLYIDTQC